MTPSPKIYRLLIVGIVLWACAGAIYVTLHATYGYRPAYVHVRWAPSVNETAREQIAQRYSLTRGELREGTTWGYYLTDLSTDNIRALVQDPAIEDTHQINRLKFRIWRMAPRAAYANADAPWIPATLEWLVLASLALGATAIGLAVLGRINTPAVFQGPLTMMTTVFTEPSTAARDLAEWIRRWRLERARRRQEQE